MSNFSFETHPDNSNPYPDRFQNLQKLSRDKGDGGLPLVATVENGFVMLDFGRPVQALGLTDNDARAMIALLVEAIMVNEIKGSVDKAQQN